MSIIIRNANNPHLLCPECNEKCIKIIGVSFLSCPNYHRFFQCPICLDTRNMNKNLSVKNLRICGLYHKYYLCPVHNIPNLNNFPTYSSLCSCKKTGNINEYTDKLNLNNGLFN